MAEAPAGRCRKQKPTVTALWPWRHVKIEGRSLRFFENESDTQPRGSSIEDVTGCLIGRERETFRVDSEPGEYYVVTLTRKNHANGLPDLFPPLGTKPDGVARMCFKTEDERDDYYVALTHLAAGRRWDGSDPPQSQRLDRGTSVASDPVLAELTRKLENRRLTRDTFVVKEPVRM